jgi:hypothetical protein
MERRGDGSERREERGPADQLHRQVPEPTPFRRGVRGATAYRLAPVDVPGARNTKPRADRRYSAFAERHDCPVTVPGQHARSDRPVPGERL